MSSAIGAVFTYLLANFQTACQAVDSTALIIDGPVASEIPPPPAPMIYVGATNPLNAAAAQGVHSYIEIGQRKVEEDFTVPCLIDAAVGDADQAACRASALSMFDACLGVIAADQTLGGALLAGRFAEITDFQMVQTDGEDEAVDGRRCVLMFSVHCTNHYTP